MDPTTKTGARAVRALIHTLLRARLEWRETTSPSGKPGSLRVQRHSYTGTYDGVTYTITKNHTIISLYRNDGTGMAELIATSDCDAVRSELTGLFRHARKSYDAWTSAEVDRYYLQNLEETVPIRDLFALVDRETIALDYADEKAYIATNAGKMTHTDEIISYRDREYVKALRMIRSIVKCSENSDSMLTVDDSDPIVLNWRAKIPTDFSAGKTDLHFRICPNFRTAEDDVKKSAVHFAVLLILLSMED